MELNVYTEVLKEKGVDKDAKIGLELTIKKADGTTHTLTIPKTVNPKCSNKLRVRFIPCIKRADICNPTLVHECGSVIVENTMLHGCSCVNNKLERFEIINEPGSFRLTRRQKRYCLTTE